MPDRSVRRVARSSRALRPMTAALLLLVPLALVAVPRAQPRGEPIDLGAVTRLKQVAFTDSRVMALLQVLSDRHGPVLTGGPAMRSFADRAVRQMSEWGFANVGVERYPFGRGWVNERFDVQMVSPQASALIGGVTPWTGSTAGRVRGEVVLVDEASNDWQTQAHGRLQGKFVLMKQFSIQLPPFPSARYSDAELAERAKVRVPASPRPPMTIFDVASAAMQRQAAVESARYWQKEGAVAVIRASLGNYGTFAGMGWGSWQPGDPQGVPEVILANEHHGRLQRLLERQVPVTLEMDIRNRFDEQNRELLDIVGEIPGSDKADEVVMLGGHFDAVPFGTGATDDVAGCVTAIEALRLIKEAGLQPRRTIRVGCWSGHEQGLFGSRAYVKAHLGDPGTMRLQPAHQRFSVYLNLDNGAGAIRGISAQGNDAAAAMFRDWLEPFRNMGATTVSLGSGVCDNLSFDQVGVPGFMFIQDFLDYGERSHHTNMDVFERAPASDMIGNSVIMAAFAYQAAMRDALVPRKPLPRPVQWAEPLQ